VCIALKVEKLLTKLLIHLVQCLIHYFKMQQYFGIFVFGSGFSDIRINNSYRISKDLLYVDNGN
jgi:hypothetical protein